MLVLQLREDNTSDMRIHPLRRTHRPSADLLLSSSHIWVWATGLCCVMLRALWDFANIECLGLVVSLGGKRAGETASAGLAEQLPEYLEITKTLRAVGLSHVPVHGGQLLGDDKELPHVEDILKEIYEAAPPLGLTLVLSSSVTGVAIFAQQ